MRYRFPYVGADLRRSLLLCDFVFVCQCMCTVYMSFTIFELFDVEEFILTLITKSGVTQGHCK